MGMTSLVRFPGPGSTYLAVLGPLGLCLHTDSIPFNGASQYDSVFFNQTKLYWSKWCETWAFPYAWSPWRSAKPGTKEIGLCFKIYCQPSITWGLTCKHLKFRWYGQDHCLGNSFPWCYVKCFLWPHYFLFWWFLCATGPVANDRKKFLVLLFILDKAIIILVSNSFQIFSTQFKKIKLVILKISPWKRHKIH